jgi:hypothetical protein
VPLLLPPLLPLPLPLPLPPPSIAGLLPSSPGGPEPLFDFELAEQPGRQMSHTARAAKSSLAIGIVMSSSRSDKERYDRDRGWSTEKLRA